MDFHTTPDGYPGDLPPRELREATTTLQQEIARRRQGIADLVAHLDSQVPADQAATAA